MKKINTKTNTKSSKFLTGAIIGGVLGVAAGIFAASKTGKKMGNEIKDKSIDFYKSVAPKLKQMKAMTGVQYKEFIEKATMQYAKSKKLTAEEVKNIKKQAETTWKHLEKHF